VWRGAATLGVQISHTTRERQRDRGGQNCKRINKTVHDPFLP
jgi:hypothetical protein